MAIVTIAAAVSSIAIGFSTIPVARAQDADRLCALSPTASPMITRQLIEKKPPCDMPDLSFSDKDGKTVSLSDFRGQTLLVNLWATWCPPCVREMPALDRLQGKLGGADFQVIAISQDRGGASVAQKWFTDNNMKNLALFADPKASAGRTLKAPGLPVSIIVDPEGREVARLYGDTAWDSDAMISRLRHWMP